MGKRSFLPHLHYPQHSSRTEGKPKVPHASHRFPYCIKCFSVQRSFHSFLEE